MKSWVYHSFHMRVTRVDPDPEGLLGTSDYLNFNCILMITKWVGNISALVETFHLGPS